MAVQAVPVRGSPVSPGEPLKISKKEPRPPGGPLPEIGSPLKIGAGVMGPGVV